jgi:sugar phosphate isomerase/epimerase
MGEQSNRSLRSRRAVLQSGLAACVAPSSLASHVPNASQQDSGNSICAFIKFVQELSFEQLAEQIAAAGFSGIEATVRKGGQIEPEHAATKLPQLVEALRKHGLDITVMATNVLHADDPTSVELLKTASRLGIRRYRMGYHRYDLRRPVVPQLAEFKPEIDQLAALNRELGITAVYQNHAGTRYVGATIWDLQRLLADVDPQEIGIAFDIRHATAESGVSWPVLFNVAQPHMQAVYVKDFVWQQRKPQNVPLGEGQVDPAFFNQLRRSGFDGPISLHVEYLPEAGTEANMQALRTDLEVLQRLLQK